MHACKTTKMHIPARTQYGLLRLVHTSNSQKLCNQVRRKTTVGKLPFRSKSDSFKLVIHSLKFQPYERRCRRTKQISTARVGRLCMQTPTSRGERVRLYYNHHAFLTFARYLAIQQMSPFSLQMSAQQDRARCQAKHETFAKQGVFINRIRLNTFMCNAQVMERLTNNELIVFQSNKKIYTDFSEMKVP